ncbi:Hsp20/alpha crystallin family protein [Paenibacillus sediminis]|uniref:HSP20 family protein n=1 Tax=Paenibacillus sediminis TaxID=664909 RepID=A0ABS4H6F1_9BACL|nr:Hsp20/alpha crystallin family protein [Paenibacillus sediminis]MBP1938120.1 HSP20 family protein [Paenibacillus sediminis]
MALIPYEPFRSLDHWRRDFDRFFDNFPPSLAVGERFGAHRIDVYETDQEVVASCEIPGLEKKEDVHIEIEGDMLTIAGVINRTNEVKEDQMHRRERFTGRFSRSIHLPAQVKREGVKASYKNGILEVRMPKDQAGTRRRIDVDFH